MVNRPEVMAFDHAVVISPRAALLLVAAVRALEAAHVNRGARLTAALAAVVAQLDEAAAVGRTDGGTDADARASDPPRSWAPLCAHDLLDTRQAAAALGCSPGNVRDLARRGALPAHRTGGRWLFERDGVDLRADRCA